MNRAEFFHLIWSKPIVKIAGELGVSDSWVIKLCRLYDIPRPPPGYWNKLAAGKPVCLKPELPGNADDVVLVKSSQSTEYGGGDRTRKILSRLGDQPKGLPAKVEQDSPTQQSRDRRDQRSDKPSWPEAAAGQGPATVADLPAGPLSDGARSFRGTLVDEAVRWQRQQALFAFIDRMVEEAVLLPEPDRRKIEEWARQTLDRLRRSDPMELLMARLLQI